jgi:hypothetical protein
MTPPNDGGPASPVDISCYDGDRSRLYGMSLRDYFAAAALQGLMARIVYEPACAGTAADCYAFADAMLAQREVKP